MKNDDTRARISPSTGRVERPPPSPLARWCRGGVGGGSAGTRRARLRCGSRSPYRFRAPPSHRSSSGAGLAAAVAGCSLLPSHQPTERPTTAADNINPPGPPTQPRIYMYTYYKYIRLLHCTVVRCARIVYFAASPSNDTKFRPYKMVKRGRNLAPEKK